MKLNNMKLMMLFVAMALTAACNATPSATSDPALSPGQAPQTIEQIEEQPQVEVVAVKSQKMGRDINATVVVPAQYFDPDLQEEQFPVVYLLHGADGSYRDWPTKADLDDLSSEYGVIIVCPDGQDSWYFDSPVDPKMQFETYVSQELVAYIDSHYRTYANRYMRAITGLSMGGHGSLFLAFRHPDVFWSCGSMSGCMDITKFPEKWHIKDRLGEYASNKQSWQDHAVCNQIDKVKASTLKPAQNIIIDDGTKDIFYSHNVTMHEILLENNIDHDFIVRPGAHSWDYWVNALDYHMVFFSKAFSRGFTLMNQPQSTDNQ